MDVDPLERLWLTVKSFMEKIDSLLARNKGTSLFLVTQHAAILLHIIEKVVADIDPEESDCSSEELYRSEQSEFDQLGDDRHLAKRIIAENHPQVHTLCMMCI